MISETPPAKMTSMAVARIAGLLPLVAAFSLACSADGIMRPPEPSEEIQPTLIGLTFRQTEPEPGWALSLRGRLAAGTPMTGDQFVAVTVMTDDGAEVEAELSLRRMCNLPNDIEYACDEILVGLEAGRSPDLILPLVNELDGAYFNVLTFDSFTNVAVKLFSGDELAAISRFTKHEGVLFAEVNGFVSIPEDVPPPPLEELALPLFAFIRTRELGGGSMPELATGTLAVGPGTEVTARYLQPDGSTLEASITIQ